MRVLDRLDQGGVQQARRACEPIEQRPRPFGIDRDAGEPSIGATRARCGDDGGRIAGRLEAPPDPTVSCPIVVGHQEVAIGCGRRVECRAANGRERDTEAKVVGAARPQLGERGSKAEGSASSGAVAELRSRTTVVTPVRSGIG